jgi:predicted dehydrogenase
MTNKKRCAIVGIGNRAHSWVGGIVNHHPDRAELVGLCDVNLERCQDINRGYGTSAAVYDDYERMLAEVKPDLVIVCSPEHCHAKHICQALDAGAKVATEKPLCVTAEDTQAILAAEKRHGRKIFMAFNYRHIPLLSRLKELLVDGAVGRPVSMDLTWYLDYRGHGASYFRRWHRMMEKSGGLLVTKACHHFDLANWLMNDRPERVYARGRQNFFGPGHNPYQGTRCCKCDYADKCEWYTDVCVQDRSKQLSEELGYQVGKVRDYVRDLCPFAPEADIYDTMGLTVEYQNGGILNYSLNAGVPYEGWNMAVNGTGGRIETNITDNKPHPGWQPKFRIVSPDGKVLGADDNYRITDWPAEYAIHVMPHDGANCEVRVPNLADGHGGGDFKIFDAVFADARPADDPLGRFASAIDGALSSAIGTAANQSIATGLPVEIRDIIGAEA